MAMQPNENRRSPQYVEPWEIEAVDLREQALPTVLGIISIWRIDRGTRGYLWSTLAAI